MKTHKRIILVGPSATGKNFIREKFREKGFKIDCSYTSRPIRPGEVENMDYHFINRLEFEMKVDLNHFYEWVKYEDKYYGTGLYEWENADVFIMETDGVSKILPIDRPNCLVIYINTPFDIRLKRMRKRGWDSDKIHERVQVDIEKFRNFKDYDLEISSETHE